MSAAQEPFGYVVTLDTEHFHFEAHGITEEQANEAMGHALNVHRDQYGLADEWWTEYEFQTFPFLPGTGFRDDAPLYSGAPQ